MSDEVQKTSQENPNSPAGWAVQEAVNPDAHPAGELQAIEQQKRQDTAAWEDSQNRSPMDTENPAQPAGFAVPPATNAPIQGQGADALQAPVVAKVFVSKTAGKVDGGKVLLGTSQENHMIGEVQAVVADKFWVEWRDGQNTVEAKSDYELVIRDDENE